jgi:hypothetical protein
VTTDDVHTAAMVETRALIQSLQARFDAAGDEAGEHQRDMGAYSSRRNPHRSGSPWNGGSALWALEKRK